MSIRKARQGKKNESCNQQNTYYFDIAKCQTCPLREGCYKPGTKSKTYSVRIISETHQRAIDYQKTEQFAERKKMRGEIESKNAEMKQAHGIKSQIRGFIGHEDTSLSHNNCSKREANSETSRGKNCLG